MPCSFQRQWARDETVAQKGYTSTTNHHYTRRMRHHFFDKLPVFIPHSFLGCERKNLVSKGVGKGKNCYLCLFTTGKLSARKLLFTGSRQSSPLKRSILLQTFIRRARRSHEVLLQDWLPYIILLFPCTPSVLTSGASRILKLCIAGIAV